MKLHQQLKLYQLHSETNMLSFKELREKRMAVSADYKVTASGRKVHKMKKIADTEDDLEDKEDDKEDKKDVKESVDEGAVPAHMQGKQKPYVSSDGKGNYEVLGNRGHTKATFTRAEHGKDAHKKAQAHLRSKYDEYMKEETELDEAVETTHEFHLRQAAHHEKQGNTERAKYHRDRANDWRVKSAHDATKQAERELEHKYRKEETELDEAVDKQEQRFIQLARLGLVDKSNVSKLRIAVDQLKADKQLSVAQRTLLLGVMMDLVDLVTGDDAVFQRVKMDVQKEAADPCWKGYQMVGMKDKNGKKVPNCVPEVKESEDPPFDKPYTTVKPDVTDKSGAKHTARSTVRHLARLALKKQQQKAKSKE